MFLSDFNYELPASLIAKEPLADRCASRLLVVEPLATECVHSAFHALAQYVQPGDCLVVNDTCVMNARLYGHKTTGGRVELFIIEIHDSRTASAYVKAGKAPRPGTIIQLAHGRQCTLLRREGQSFVIEMDDDIQKILQEQGILPLPPYMGREATSNDNARYQTVYATKLGAVAAPTAGLHFTHALIEHLQAYGVDVAQLTLHVGAGTFTPIRTERIDQHTMHSESFCVSQRCVDQIAACKARGGRIIAVGTTTLRALEAVARLGPLQAFTGSTDLYITPGFQFHVVDRLITNFHLPQSTLLILVSAFAGIETIQRAYATAIAHKYRFFSYGDAMLLTRV